MEKIDLQRGDVLILFAVTFSQLPVHYYCQSTCVNNPRFSTMTKSSLVFAEEVEKMEPVQKKVNFPLWLSNIYGELVRETRHIREAIYVLRSEFQTEELQQARRHDPLRLEASDIVRLRSEIRGQRTVPRKRESEEVRIVS